MISEGKKRGENKVDQTNKNKLDGVCFSKVFNTSTVLNQL